MVKLSSTHSPFDQIKHIKHKVTSGSLAQLQKRETQTGGGWEVREVAVTESHY